MPRDHYFEQLEAYANALKDAAIKKQPVKPSEGTAPRADVHRKVHARQYVIDTNNDLEKDDKKTRQEKGILFDAQKAYFTAHDVLDKKFQALRSIEPYRGGILTTQQRVKAVMELKTEIIALDEQVMQEGVIADENSKRLRDTLRARAESICKAVDSNEIKAKGGLNNLTTAVGLNIGGDATSRVHQSYIIHTSGLMDELNNAIATKIKFDLISKVIAAGNSLGRHLDKATEALNKVNTSSTPRENLLKLLKCGYGLLDRNFDYAKKLESESASLGESFINDDFLTLQSEVTNKKECMLSIHEQVNSFKTQLLKTIEMIPLDNIEEYEEKIIKFVDTIESISAKAISVRTEADAEKVNKEMEKLTLSFKDLNAKISSNANRSQQPGPSTGSSSSGPSRK